MGIDTVAGIVRTHGRERPDAPALEFEGRTLTFGELDRRSNQLANALAAAGVAKILFFVFLVLFIASLISHAAGRT